MTEENNRDIVAKTDQLTERFDNEPEKNTDWETNEASGQPGGHFKEKGALTSYFNATKAQMDHGIAVCLPPMIVFRLFRVQQR
jgi:hypothetical protein